MKLLFFIDPNWAFGMIHQPLVKHLTAKGHIADIISWYVGYQRDEMRLIADRYDRVVTIASGVKVAMQDYGIPPEKLIVFSYSDYDIVKVQQEGISSAIFEKFAAYGVPSHNLLSISLSLGITRIPSVLPIGLDMAKYDGPIPEKLSIVGYGTALSRKNHYGVEFKRGALAEECAKAAGLEFKPAHAFNYLAVPGYWQTVDCLLASALYETAPIPQLEAAASGRLVLSSAVGNTAELACAGIVELIPSNERLFREVAINKLKEYAGNPEAFRATCEQAREGVSMYDWKKVLPLWEGFFERACAGSLRE